MLINFKGLVIYKQLPLNSEIKLKITKKGIRKKFHPLANKHTLTHVNAILAYDFIITLIKVYFRITWYITI